MTPAELAYPCRIRAVRTNWQGQRRFKKGEILIAVGYEELTVGVNAYVIEGPGDMQFMVGAADYEYFGPEIEAMDLSVVRSNPLYGRF